MDKLIEAITFAVVVLGASILIFTCYFVISRFYRFLNDLSKDDNKKLIRDTIDENNKIIEEQYRERSRNGRFK